MLQALIRASLNNAGLVVALFIAVMAALFVRLQVMPVDVFPELNAPTVVIMTEAGGLAADEVEQYVTFPIEGTMGGIPGVRRMRSSSAISLSIVWIEFDWGEDIYRARQLVAERLAGLEGMLPEGIHAEIAPVTSLTGEIMLVSLSSKRHESGRPLVSDLDVRAYAEFDLRTRILAVSGISQVVAIGGELPEFQVNVHPERLLLYDMTIDEVLEAARSAHSTASGGYLPDFQSQEMPIRQAARVRSAADVAATLVRYHDGQPVTLGDVAEVKLGPSPKRGTAAVSGERAVVLSIQKAPGTNTLKLTQELDRVFEDLQGALPEGLVLDHHVFRQEDFINTSITNVEHVLRDAAIIVGIVLMLFLMNWRTTLITLTAIPTSLALSLLLLDWLGMSINVMTLGGLAVAIGELVDDAIIDVENVFRRLRENYALEPDARTPFVRVVYDASNEIRASVVFATVIIALVFVPLLFLQGLEGRFFRPLGIAYITSIMASLLVALTLTPALCKLMMRDRVGGGGEHEDGLLVRWLKGLYRPLLALAIRLRWIVMILAVIATIGCLIFASTFGTSFLPEFNEGTFTVFLMAPPGTSLDASDRMARGVERRLGEIEGVRHVSRRTGRAERDQHAEPVSSSELEVSVKPGFDKKVVRKAIDKVLGQVPGITTMVGQPIEHRLSHILSGTPAAIAIDIYGEDLDVLRRLAKQVSAELEQIPGARDVNANREVMVSTVPVRYRLDDLARWGLTPAEAAHQLEVAFRGEVVANVNQGIRRYALVVRLAPESRRSPDDIRQLLLRGRGGALVSLTEVADVGLLQASNLIARDDMRRKATVSCNVADGANLGHLVEEVRRRVTPIVQAEGCAVKFGGQFEAQRSASRTIMTMGAATVVAVFILLVMALGSARTAALVLVNLPLALIGGVLAIFLTAETDPVTNLRMLFSGGGFQAPVISIASMVGFVTLFGIAVRNGILLVNHYQHLLDHEGADLSEAVTRGSEERLVPILMTALTAVLGLLPLALAAGKPGSELLAPLAIVVLGGLVTSTFLNLIVVPAGYTIIFKGGTTPGRQGRDPELYLDHP